MNLPKVAARRLPFLAASLLPTIRAEGGKAAMAARQRRGDLAGDGASMRVMVGAPWAGVMIVRSTSDGFSATAFSGIHQIFGLTCRRRRWEVQMRSGTPGPAIEAKPRRPRPIRVSSQRQGDSSR
jgi:hypothetical protein